MDSDNRDSCVTSTRLAIKRGGAEIQLSWAHVCHAKCGVARCVNIKQTDSSESEASQREQTTHRLVWLAARAGLEHA
eukprot:4382435-Amphidinium_carterae.1